MNKTYLSIIIFCLLLMPIAIAEDTSKTLIAAKDTSNTATTATTTTTTASTCKSSKELEADIIACKKSGGVYKTSADKNGCKVVECEKKKVVCPTDIEIKNQIADCSKYWKYDTTTDSYGCKRVNCKKDCPDVNKLVTDCKTKGMSYEKGTDAKGCTTITCKKVEKKPVSTTATAPIKKDLTCKKYTDSNNCIWIDCNDGFRFNSCKYCSEGAVAVSTAAPTSKVLPTSKVPPTVTAAKAKASTGDVADNATTPGPAKKKGVFNRMGGWFKGLFG